ncbi:hypothetical protein [Streptomyces capparidis]
MPETRRAALHEHVNRLGRRVHLARMSGRTEEAKRLSDAEMAALEELYEASPLDRAIRLVLAGALYNRSVVLEELSLPEEAVETALRAQETYRGLLPGDPERIAPLLADSQGRLGRLLAAVGDRASARRESAAAVEAYRGLARRDPRHEPGLARALWQRCFTLRALGDAAEARAVAGEALARYRACHDAGRLGDADRRYFGLLALELTREAYPFTPATAASALATVEDAVLQLSALIRAGHGGHRHLLVALCLRGLCLAGLGDTDGAARQAGEAELLVDGWGGGASEESRALLSELGATLRRAAPPPRPPGDSPPRGSLRHRRFRRRRRR